MDAATLKAGRRAAENGEPVHFRIFMDAATLKESAIIATPREDDRFPHLYGCGHIEGNYFHFGNSCVFSFPHLY